MCMRGADWTSIAFQFFPSTLASMPYLQLNLSSMYTRSHSQARTFFSTFKALGVGSPAPVTAGGASTALASRSCMEISGICMLSDGVAGEQSGR